MTHQVFRAIAILGMAGLLAAAPGDAQVRASKRDADLMKQKIAVIVAHGDRAAKEPRRTTITESEVNSFLILDLGDALPAGVVEPSISALGPGRVSGRAVVDLDAVRKANGSAGLFDPRSYLTGHLPVAATGLLRTANGVGRFELQSATIGGVAIPKLFLQEIVAFYSKSPEQPAGVSLDDPFPLPARIREIQVERGHAIVVQ